MNCILDTHVWIWSQECTDKLGPRTTRMLMDPDNQLFVSTISTLEIARLVSSRAIEMKGNLRLWIRRSLELLDCRAIELSHDIALEAYSLPPKFHKDPADRIIAATARLSHLSIITADERILSHPFLHVNDARL